MLAAGTLPTLWILGVSNLSSYGVGTVIGKGVGAMILGWVFGCILFYLSKRSLMVGRIAAVVGAVVVGAASVPALLEQREARIKNESEEEALQDLRDDYEKLLESEDADPEAVIEAGVEMRQKATERLQQAADDASDPDLQKLMSALTADIEAMSRSANQIAEAQLAFSNSEFPMRMGSDKSEALRAEYAILQTAIDRMQAHRALLLGADERIEAKVKAVPDVPASSKRDFLAGFLNSYNRNLKGNVEALDVSISYLRHYEEVLDFLEANLSEWTHVEDVGPVFDTTALTDQYSELWNAFLDKEAEINAAY
ncbi:MAG: hypothetical protein ACFBZ8_13605 [Opitutales bacterium]